MVSLMRRRRSRPVDLDTSGEPVTVHAATVAGGSDAGERSLDVAYSIIP
jgi:hypothetical protein